MRRARRLLVSHGLRLDYRMQEPILDLEEGQVHTLALAPMDRFPQYLKGVRVTTIDALGLPSYLDVGGPGPKPSASPAKP